MADREELVSSKEVYRGPIFSVEQEEVRLADGSLAQRDIVRHVPAVAILPLLDNDHIILERQWREPIHDFILEIPAGKLDERDSAEPLHAAKRELNEELRMTASHWALALTFYETVGFSDAKMLLYVASGLKKVPADKELSRDYGESLDLITVSFGEMQAWLQSGRLQDQKTITAFLYWASMRQSNGKD
ncbi:NUDIX hydrolase [Eupransor demetentiae]|uniref:NUDIX family (MutT) n=1 Tax=Eupransor demetentiae TaxID=3109584 RepID=A0ABP0ERB1_9LACO|nr:8-oxo-dGTP pyrophosphatase MutT and related house-cleaning NTP pyrophosphohydrolases [Lactobacillaceae bacterium LMG 33000]